MPDRKFPINLPVRGQLDTAMPITDRPYGTLVEAKDVSPRFWGPKRGSGSFTRVWESPNTASLYDGVKLNGTANAGGLGISFEEQFRDLGTQFTLDLWFRLEDLTYAAGKNEIGLHSFINTGYIDILVHGPNVSDHERMLVRVLTTPTRATTDTLVSVTGSTRISTGSSLTDKHHVRVVRDGKYLYVYLDGVLDGSSSSLVATSPVYGAVGAAGTVTLGRSRLSGGTNINFYGRVYGAWLRDGAFTTQPIEAVMPCSPWAKNIHYAYINHNYALGGSNDHIFDSGRYGAHARLSGTSGVDYTVVSGNDSDMPAPAPVQGFKSWTTRSNRLATSVLAGGTLSTAGVS